MSDKRYTEGIAGDGAAILDNGQSITISEILDRLNDTLDEMDTGGEMEEFFNKPSPKWAQDLVDAQIKIINLEAERDAKDVLIRTLHLRLKEARQGNAHPNDKGA